MAFDNVQVRFRYRMLGYENGTAVFVGKDRGFISTDLFGNINNLHLIKSNQRTEYRKGTHFVGYSQRLHGLGGYLSDAFTGNQAKALIFFGNDLCDFHHITAHDNGKLFMRAFLINVKLNIGKVNGMQINRTRVAGYLSCKIHYLLLRTVTGIWGCMEVNCINLYASLGDHIACNRGINTAGQKEHCLAVTADRHSAGARNFHRININLFTDFNVEHNIRMMNIHAHFRKRIEDYSTHFTVYLLGIHRIILPCTTGIYLEGNVLIRIVLVHIINHGPGKLLKAFILYMDDRTDSADTKYRL